MPQFPPISQTELNEIALLSPLALPVPLLPRPYIFAFREAAPISSHSDDTIYETSSETSTDGRIDNDTADDTDVGGDWDDQTGLIRDSDTKEDEDYGVWL